MMKNYKLTFVRILAIGFIFICTTFAWFVLGGALSQRTAMRGAELSGTVTDSWGPPLKQSHPVAWITSPTGNNGRQTVRPSTSDVDVRVSYDPKRKGLLWYRTYSVEFNGKYTIPNPTPIAQTVYVGFHLPSTDTSFYNFALKLGDEEAIDLIPEKGMIHRAILVPPNGSVPLEVSYATRGLDRWDYDLGQTDRIRHFNLTMLTDFKEINFPEGTGSPTTREMKDDGWELEWNYPDVIGAQSIAMDMPKMLNAGPVAARISFFAPVSLLFFFTVLVILGTVRGAGLHPMHYFFLAAGCFAFQLLFAYLVDLVPIHLSFIVASVVSLVMVGGYVHAVGGKSLSRIAIPAQLAYMFLFSYSFFFDGVSGLTITVGAIATLAILMLATAKVDWEMKFAKSPKIPAPRPETTV